MEHIHVIKSENTFWEVKKQKRQIKYFPNAERSKYNITIGI